MLSQNPDQEKSWGLIAGTLLLATSAFLGCESNSANSNQEISFDNQLASQTVTPVPAANDSRSFELPSITINPSNQPLINQLERMERALAIITENCNKWGFTGTKATSSAILQEFVATESELLLAIKSQSSPEISSSLEKAYESLSIAHRAFSRDEIGAAQLGGDSGLNGSMPIVYEAQARLTLTRLKLSVAE